MSTLHLVHIHSFSGELDDGIIISILKIPDILNVFNLLRINCLDLVSQIHDVMWMLIIIHSESIYFTDPILYDCDCIIELSICDINLLSLLRQVHLNIFML